MAVQMNVIYSSLFKGAGIIAGGPFYCAEDNVMIAQTSCMKTPGLISLLELETITQSTYLTTHTIDNPSNLKHQPVWLFSGTSDTEVVQGVEDKLQDYYKHYGANIKYINNMAAEHAFPTDLSRNQNPCDFFGPPYINNCGFDGVGDMFSHIISSDLKPRDMDWQSAGELILFDQTEFVNPLYVYDTSSLDKLGYAYIPHSCNTDQCQIHVAIHGCHQGRESLESLYVKNTGYLEWAAANDIVVLFP